MARKPLEGRFFNDTELRTKDKVNSMAGKKGIINRSHGTDTGFASKWEQMGVNDRKIHASKKLIEDRAKQIEKAKGSRYADAYRYGASNEGSKIHEIERKEEWGDNRKVRKNSEKAVLGSDLNKLKAENKRKAESVKKKTTSKSNPNVNAKKTAAKKASSNNSLSALTKGSARRKTK